MKLLAFFLFLLLNISSVKPSEQSVATGSIHVTVKGLKSKKGQVGFLLFTNKDGFPSDYTKAYKQVLIPITGDQLTYVFTDVPVGKYAVSVMHDENMNKKLDTNFMGIPKEGYGVSNNAVGSLGPPKFEDAAFMLKEGSYTTEITMTY